MSRAQLQQSHLRNYTRLLALPGSTYPSPYPPSGVGYAMEGAKKTCGMLRQTSGSAAQQRSATSITCSRSLGRLLAFCDTPARKARACMLDDEGKGRGREEFED